MKSTLGNAEADTAKVLRALKSIERIARPQLELGYCNIDPYDLLKTIHSVAVRTIKNGEEEKK